jgi:hypothetical protein
VKIRNHPRDRKYAEASTIFILFLRLDRDVTYWCSLRAHTAYPYLLHELCRRRFCLSLTWYTPHAHTFPASTRFAPNILGIRASVPKTFQMTVIFKPDMRCRDASSRWPLSAAHHFAEQRFRFPAPPPSTYPSFSLHPLRGPRAAPRRLTRYLWTPPYLSLKGGSREWARRGHYWALPQRPARRRCVRSLAV